MIVKNVKEFSEEQQLSMILHGISFSMYVANEDKEKYAKFKNGEIDMFSEETIRDMNILSLLERLGYRMDELGTYLYKDVIAELYEFLKGISTREDMDRCRMMLTELNDAFSQFYHNIAREDKEMGVKTFHLYIEEAMEHIDENAIDSELAVKVFGSDPEEINYGLQAFQLASYASNLYSMKHESDFKRTRILNLSNSPRGFITRDNY